MDNFDLKKYLAEGKLYEEEQVDPQVDTLQQALGVKVTPARYGKIITSFIQIAPQIEKNIMILVLLKLLL
jgi:hypothetical protein